MARLDADAVWTVLYGDPRPRWAVLGSVVALLALASLAFLLGLPVGLYEFFGWLLLVFALPFVAGAVDAGVLTTVLSVWFVTLWGYAFPPLVGYLTGDWTGTGRYTHPRLAAYAHGSARGELLDGLDQALGFGTAVAIVVGAAGYLLGSAVTWTARKSQGR